MAQKRKIFTILGGSFLKMYSKIIFQKSFCFVKIPNCSKSIPKSSFYYIYLETASSVCNCNKQALLTMLAALAAGEEMTPNLKNHKKHLKRTLFLLTHLT